jgi:hypothetical protein
MRAVIRYFHSPDIDNLETYQPTYPDRFGFLLQMFIGPDDGPGQESFDVIVCTPRWLSETYADDQIVLGRHMIIVFHYDFARLKSFLERQVSEPVGETWNDLAQYLTRLGRWEFEDYRAV